MTTARQMIAVIRALRKFNKNTLERRAGAYRSSRKKTRCRLVMSKGHATSEANTRGDCPFLTKFMRILMIALCLTRDSIPKPDRWQNLQVIRSWNVDGSRVDEVVIETQHPTPFRLHIQNVVANNQWGTE